LLAAGLHRDFIWLPDFPRYGFKKVDFAGLHRMRMEMVHLPDALLTPAYRAQGEQAEARRIERLQQYRCATNTQSCDAAHCREFLQVAASRQLGSWVSAGNMGQAPLAERFRLQHPYHLVPSQRFAARDQKGLITECSLKLAKVRTTYGTRASSRVTDMPGEVLSLAATYSKTLTRKMSQRYFSKKPFALVPADAADASRLFVTSSFTQGMLRVLEQHGIVNSGCRAADIPVRFLPNFVAVGHFIQTVELTTCGLSMFYPKRHIFFQVAAGECRMLWASLMRWRDLASMSLF